MLYAHMYAVFSTASISNFLYPVINPFDNVSNAKLGEIHDNSFLYAYFKHLQYKGLTRREEDPRRPIILVSVICFL